MHCGVPSSLLRRKLWMRPGKSQHGLMLVTRNLRDVQDLGVEVINPWIA